MALTANILSGLASCKRDAKSWIKVYPLSGDERSKTKTNIHIRVSQLAEPRLQIFLLVLAPRIFVLQYSILCNSPSYKKYVSMVLRIPTNAKLVSHQWVKHAKIRNFNIQYIYMYSQNLPHNDSPFPWGYPFTILCFTVEQFCFLLQQAHKKEDRQ